MRRVDRQIDRAGSGDGEDRGDAGGRPVERNGDDGAGGDPRRDQPHREAGRARVERGIIERALGID